MASKKFVNCHLFFEHVSNTFVPCTVLLVTGDVKEADSMLALRRQGRNWWSGNIFTKRTEDKNTSGRCGRIYLRNAKSVWVNQAKQRYWGHWILMNIMHMDVVGGQTMCVHTRTHTTRMHCIIESWELPLFSLFFTISLQWNFFESKKTILAPHNSNKTKLGVTEILRACLFVCLFF